MGKEKEGRAECGQEVRWSRGREAGSSNPIPSGEWKLYLCMGCSRSLGPNTEMSKNLVGAVFDYQ